MTTNRKRLERLEALVSRGGPGTDPMDYSPAVASPAGLAQLASRGRFQTPRHVALLDAEVVNAATTPDAVLVVTFPPRHGKSELVSKHTPPWYLGRWPDRRVLLTSYEAEFAAGWGRKARDILTEWGPSAFGVRVRDDSRAAHRWEVEGRGGEMYTAGAGGPITGRGADLIITDDPVKNAEEALSATRRKKVWDWYLSTVLTRKEPGASEIVIMTRWHTEDLVGRILDEARAGGRQVRELRLPALAEPDDPLGRQPGEALWPERYPADKLREIERLQGFWWSALYQGRPVPMGGALFKADWFGRFSWVGGSGPRCDGYGFPETGGAVEAGECVRFVLADPSLGQKNSDRCAMAVFAVTPDARLLVLWAHSERIPVESIVPRLDQVARAWDVDWAGIESNNFQVMLLKSAGQQLRCPVRGLDPAGRKKLARATTAIELANAGRLLVPEAEPWVAAYLTELCCWTGSDGDTDDLVDVTAYAGLETLKYAEVGADDTPGAGRPRYAGGMW